MPIPHLVNLQSLISRENEYEPNLFAILFNDAHDTLPYYPPHPFPEPGSKDFESEAMDILTEARAWLRKRFDYVLTSIEGYHAGRIAREVAMQLHHEQHSSHCLEGVSIVAEEVALRMFEILYGPNSYWTFRGFLTSDEQNSRKNRGQYADAEQATESGALLPTQAYLMRLQEEMHRL